jgi:3-dehydroquinate dehydratase type I
MSLICISLIENTAAKFTIAAGECKAKGADLIEIRLDYLTEPLSINLLKRLAKIKFETGLPEILTFRPTWDGGKFDSYEERRLDILEDGVNLGFDYIDLELKTDQKKRDRLLKIAKEAGVTTVVSYHNYKQTPTWKDIFNKMKEIEKTGCDIIKVVYNTESLPDALNVLKAGSAAKNLSYRFTVMGLGPFGHVTRILAPIIGCEWIYAALEEGKEVVEGQIDIKTLKDFWSIQ